MSAEQQPESEVSTDPDAAQLDAPRLLSLAELGAELDAVSARSLSEQGEFYDRLHIQLHAVLAAIDPA